MQTPSNPSPLPMIAPIVPNIWLTKTANLYAKLLLFVYCGPAVHVQEPVACSRHAIILQS